jgi:hypothetical protein
MQPLLSQIALGLEEGAGGASAANASLCGWDKRIAVAAETIAGAGTSANENLEGYMLRAAIAIETVEGVALTGAGQNFWGYLARLVYALENNAGVSSGSLLKRAAVAAGLYAAVSFKITLEDSSGSLLLETGDFLLLEDAP